MAGGAGLVDGTARHRSKTVRAAAGAPTESR
jgi:hypothetical protein